MVEPWLSAGEIAAHLGITKDTVYIWINEKAMPAHRVGRLWKLKLSEVDRWIHAGGERDDERRRPRHDRQADAQPAL